MDGWLVVCRFFDAVQLGVDGWTAGWWFVGSSSLFSWV